jgi:Ca2+-binding EF-hand superfamily protein
VADGARDTLAAGRDTLAAGEGTERQLSTWTRSKLNGSAISEEPVTQDSQVSKFGAWLWKSLTTGPAESARNTLWGRRSDRSESAEQRNRLANMVTSTKFELTMAAVILTNALCICAEAQYTGMQSGYKYGVARSTKPADQVWPRADTVFFVIEWFYGILFTAELLLKILAVPRKTLRDSWTLIDGLVVTFFWIEALSSDLPFPPTLIRLARMARLLRFLRVVKTIRGFASLYLMLQSIKGSVSALGWSSVVLLLGEMTIALALNLFLSDYWESDSEEWTQAEKIQLYEYFGTFSKALLTMIEMLLGNWFAITRILVRFHEGFMLFGISHQLGVGFAVIEVISGVFLNETFKVASLDDSIMMNEVRRAAKAESAQLTEFFKQADKDGSGLVDQDELKKVMKNKQVEEWLSAMGLDMSDIDKVFRMLDKDGDGFLTPEELVGGASMLKKPARAMDLADVQTVLENLNTRVAAMTK